MNKNYIPKYKYNRVMKNDLNFISVESFLESEENKWSAFQGKLIKGFEDESNSLTTFITTNEIQYTKEVTYEPESLIKETSEIHIREKGYHKFVDITLQASPANSTKITIITLNEDINEIRKSDSQFQPIQNIDFALSKIKCEEIISNIAFDIAGEFKIEPFNLQIRKILCHPVDTQPIHIYETVIKIFAQILNIENSAIKNKIEEKLCSYAYLFSEMDPATIQFIKSNGTEEYNGMRLVWYYNQMSSNSVLMKSFEANSLMAEEIKNHFKKTKESNIAASCVPIYRDAIVYRNRADEIIGYFHICFECAKIESHNRTEMPVTAELMKNLKKILNPPDNNLYDDHVN